mmetsp:Transcript_802/g.1989  ORF Transcript_802/g.1989 Transcript_802/m.1989 type:complete len:238 (-) Transcript_802:83-796(-)
MHHDGMERKYHLVVGMVVPPSPASPSSTVAPAIAAATMVTSPATSSSSTTVESSATAPSSPATVLAAGTRSRLLVMVSRHVDALGGDLEVSSLEFRPVQLDGVRNRGLRLKFQVCVTLRFSRVLVADNRHPLHRPARLKVPQEFLGSRAVVHLSHVDRCSVTVLAGNRGLAATGLGVATTTPSCFSLLFLLEIVCFLGDAGGLGLHALDFLLELFEVFLVVIIVVVVVVFALGSGGN